MYATTGRSGLATYQQNAVTTASPARLLVMLVERLVLDTERALAAGDLGDWPSAYPHLLHAQDIVTELDVSLEPDQMAGGQQLSALYRYLLNLLVEANVGRDLAKVGEARDLSRQLCDMWREAAMAAALQ